ncbi:hypothetical protein GCM10025866_25780 [Naasia aerilata]|uniref:Zinc finger CHC2-type domain-containing protein n=1 Tax=Naasia aerilata TaxID=1162966 RepID=A0ABN6XNU3_9MICO|nr:hypothetical protein GCM10025866_25780 [Naasia aerilata]
MAGRILKSDIDEVRARVNLGDVIGDYVSLKSAGVGSLKGLCPFHDERSPSFHVRPQVGMYHCFGCGEGGDVYTFLQKMDHVTFAEAVERMAAKVGYTLHYEDGGSAAQESGNRARLLAANRAAGSSSWSASRPRARIPAGASWASAASTVRPPRTSAWGSRPRAGTS